MIINTGQRTDIPAFYSKWFINRIRDGYVLVRNPYYPTIVTKFLLNPEVVDVIGFCTKNPRPMFPYLDEIKDCDDETKIVIAKAFKEIAKKHHMELRLRSKEKWLKDYDIDIDGCMRINDYERN